MGNYTLYKSRLKMKRLDSNIYFHKLQRLKLKYVCDQCL